MSPPSDSRFRLAEQRQSWRVWGDAVVLFEPLSGDTHRIDHPAGRILALVAGSESSRADVVSALAPAVSVEEIDEALNLLLAMELVEPA